MNEKRQAQEIPRRWGADSARLLSRSEMIRAAVFVGSGLLVVASYVYTTVTVDRMSRQIETTSGVLARLCAEASFPATRNFELEALLKDVIEQIDFPIVITDERSWPRAWRRVGIDPTLVPDHMVDSLALGRPVPERVRERVERLKRKVTELDRRHRPIPMTRPVSLEPLGHLHYGDPPILQTLRWVPWVSVGGLGLLLSLGWWGLTGIRRAERRSIWVGMALETAHQLGTPLSSLMGWVERLRSRADESRGDEVRVARAEMVETLDEMERDVDRLTKVAQRFSHVGSAPKLETQDVAAIVQAAVAYARPRLPRASGEVEIVERYQDAPPLPCNRELLEWVIENLLTNAISALDKRPGRIRVDVAPDRDTGGVAIEVEDNGRGMNPTEQRHAFEPGYTTKRRGWGLGLALSRRVVEEYHRGRLHIRRSVPGEGTVVVVLLPR